METERLAVFVIERVVDHLGRNAESRGHRAVVLQQHLQAVILLISGHVPKRGHMPHRSYSRGPQVLKSSTVSDEI